MKIINTENFNIKTSQIKKKRKDNGEGFWGGFVAPVAQTVKNVAVGDENTGERGLLGRMFKGTILGDTINIVKDEAGLGGKNKQNRIREYLYGKARTPIASLGDDLLISYISGRNSGDRNSIQSAIAGLAKKFKIKEDVVAQELGYWARQREGFGADSTPGGTTPGGTTPGGTTPGGTTPGGTTPGGTTPGGGGADPTGTTIS